MRADGAFEGIVDPDFFAAAQRIIAERRRRYTDAEMLEQLTELLERRGCLSGLIIDELEDMPSSSTYRQRFGSLMRAYELVGWSPSRDYRYLETNRFLRTLHPEVVSGTVTQIERLGGAVRVDPVTDLLIINEEFTASLTIVRSTRTASGDLRSSASNSRSSERSAAAVEPRRQRALEPARRLPSGRETIRALRPPEQLK